jgi:hypothetical protein
LQHDHSVELALQEMTSGERESAPLSHCRAKLDNLRAMTPFRIALIALAILVIGLGVIIWHVIGRLVVGYAKMEADERIEENAPVSERNTK